MLSKQIVNTIPLDFITIYYLHMSLSWSSRKQLKFLFILGFLIGASILLFLLPAIFKPATCSDQKQNGEEEGVDCGGACQKLCTDLLTPPVVSWSRSFEVTEGIWNSVAYVENQNVGAYAKSVAYEFRFYGEDGSYIGSRTGTTYLEENGFTYIFEPTIQTGSQLIDRTTFTFAPNIVWQKTPREETKDDITIGKREIDFGNNIPLVRATASNNSLNEIEDITFVAVLYDEKGSAIHSSETFISSLSPQGQAEVFFTWLEPFDGVPVRVDIIPRVLPR